MAVCRAAAVFPALVLGLAFIAAGYFTGAGLAAGWGLFSLFECTSDLALLIASRGIPSRAKVLDHPDRLGLLVVASRRAAGPLVAADDTRAFARVSPPDSFAVMWLEWTRDPSVPQ
jgi:hypothetical protein